MGSFLHPSQKFTPLSRFVYRLIDLSTISIIYFHGIWLPLELRPVPDITRNDNISDSQSKERFKIDSIPLFYKWLTMWFDFWPSVKTLYHPFFSRFCCDHRSFSLSWACQTTPENLSETKMQHRPYAPWLYLINFFFFCFFKNKTKKDNIVIDFKLLERDDEE